MAHRNIIGASPIPDSYTINLSAPRLPNPQRRFENAMLENEHTVMNSSVEFPYQSAANSGAIFNEYRYSASSVGPRPNLPYHAQHVPYCYDQHANAPGAQYMPYSLGQRANGIGTSMVHPQAWDFRLPYKRKIPPAHPYENAYGSQFAASSSNFPVPLNNFPLTPMPSLCLPLHPNGRVPGYQDGNLLSAGEKYQRNVRSRHNHAPHSNLNPEQLSSSSNSTHQFHSSADISLPTAVGQWQHTSLPGTYAQWNHPTNDGWSDYVVHQSVARNCVIGGGTENNSTCNSGQSINSNAAVPTFHVSHVQGTWAGPSSYNQRQILNRTSSSYPSPAAAAAFVNTDPSLALSRNLWPVSLYNTCIYRGRTSYEVQRAYTEWNGHWRWSPQALSMVDVPPFTDSLDLFDEHRDLRLDIDSMSYEELLALEERIGSVNTGLLEDNISRCLTERIYTSLDSAQVDQDEASCPICLEEFKDGDNQGILKCHHVYHVTCIRDWLQLKNVCPVCKTPALDDYVKQKEKVL